MPVPAHFAFLLSVSGWFRHLRSEGLILVGIADNSVVPLPGSMDVLTIYLAASEPKWWLYYALIATVGAVIGGYITYALARKGGKEAMERRLRKKQAEKLTSRFERWGFWAVAVPAILPPPFPMVPFLMAAGALQFSRKKFIASLALGRGVRFLVIAALGAKFGDAIVGFFSQYYKPALAILIGLAVAAGIFALVEYLRYRKHHPANSAAPKPKAA